MKTRILSWILSLAMVMSMVPWSVAAEPVMEEVEENAEKAEDVQEPVQKENGFFNNGSTTIELNDYIFYIKNEDEDYLYKKDKSTSAVEAVLERHIISIVEADQEKKSIYLVEYIDQKSRLLKMNVTDCSVQVVCDFDGIVTCICATGSTLFYIDNNKLFSYSVETHEKSMILEDTSIAYLKCSNVLKCYLVDGTIICYDIDTGLKSKQDVVLSSKSFTPRLTAPETTNPYYTTKNIFHQCGYGMVGNGGNCTCYAFGRAYEVLGTEPKLSHGDAGGWYSYNVSYGYYSYSSDISKPVPGAVVVWSQSGAAGHVAFVEIVDGDTVITSESGWGNFYFKTVTRSIKQANLSNSYQTFLGYIYVCGADATTSNPYSTITPGNYYLVNNNSYLTVNGDNNTSVCKVSSFTGGKAQQFAVSANSKFTNGYILKTLNYSSGRVLNVYTDYTSSNGNNVTLYSLTSAASQTWRFEAKNGGYIIHPADNSSLALTNSSGSTKVMTSTGASNQIWTLVSAEDFSNIASVGEMSFNKNKYVFYKEKVSWDVAKAFCETKGGHLVTITSKEENDVLSKYIADIGIVWIGATDSEKEGTWKWVTGESFSFSNWHSGEPNNSFSTEHYLTMYKKNEKFGWDDVSVNQSTVNGFVCEIENGATYWFDVNGYVDGEYMTGLGGYVTFDVYINGSLVKKTVSDYCTEHPNGTTYEIKNIKAATGYKYDSGEGLSGKINGNHAYAKLHLSTITYDVTYNANGGSGAPSAQKKYYNSNLTLSSTKPTRTGYTFAGWKASNGTVYQPGAIYSANAATTLTAQWNIVNSTLDVNGYVDGVYKEDLSGYVTFDVYINGTLVKSRVSDFCTAYQEGSSYEIKNINAANGYKYVSGDKLSGKLSGSRVLAALTLSKMTYTVAYNANGGSGAPASQTKTHGTALALSSTKPTRTGYTFTGWKAPNGTIYQPGDSYTANEETTLTAQWKSNTVAVTGVTLNKTSTTLTVGDTETLTATVAPANATNKSVTWSTSNANVATVSNGVITAKAAGTATITVKTADGNKTATCSVTVKAATVAVTGVTLNKTSTTLTVGDTETLTATVAPANATNKSVTWSTSNANVATVSNGVITAKAAGTATITVKTADGNKTATCNVTVKAAQKPEEKPEEKPDTPIDPSAPTIAVESAKTTAGGKATVTISLKNNPGITSAKVKISFDTKVLTLVEVKDAGVLGSNMHMPTLTSPYTLYWFNGTATENYTVNGTVATLVFEVKDTAAVGIYPITATAAYGDIYNADMDEVAFQTVSGCVEVIDFTPGDLSGDGSINVKDNMMLARYLAGWEGYDETVINVKAADLNGDGKVNVKDNMILARHLAGWAGYETLPISE